MDTFLDTTLPPLDYLELSSVQLSEEQMQKCTEKFKQLVVFGAPDLPHSKRQHLLGKYTISVCMCYARDFPINIRPMRNVITDNLMLKGGAASYASRTDNHAGTNGESSATQ